MEHVFIPSLKDPKICAICIKAHVVDPECDACTNRGKLEKFMGMMLCKDCVKKERDLQEANNSPEAQEKRLQEARERERIAQMTTVSQPILSLAGVIDRARAIDQTLQVNSDVFNATTVSIAEIKAAVKADASLNEDAKNYRISELLIERFEHFQNIIIEAHKTQVEAQTAQRVIQQELNLSAQKLRQEQRDKLQLNTPTYQPSKIKAGDKTVKVKSLGTRPQTFNKKELIDTASKLQAEGYTEVSWSMIQMVAKSRNMTITQAAEELRKRLGKATQ